MIVVKLTSVRVNKRDRFPLNVWISAFRPLLMHLWVEPAGGEQKSTDVDRKTVTLIYPYPADTRQTVGSLSSAANIERRNISCRGTVVLVAYRLIIDPPLRT